MEISQLPGVIEMTDIKAGIVNVDANFDSPVKIVKEKKEIIIKTNVFEICQTHVTERRSGLFFKKENVYVHFDGKEFRSIIV